MCPKVFEYSVEELIRLGLSEEEILQLPYASIVAACAYFGGSDASPDTIRAAIHNDFNECILGSYPG
jgi:hypothetical protein